MTTWFDKIVLGTHCYIPRNGSAKLIKKLRRELTVRPRYGEKDIEIELFNDQPEDWFGVPLFHFQDLSAIAAEVLDIRRPGFPIDFKFTSGYRPGQLQVVKKFRELIERGATGIILEAPPGFGKTVVLTKILSMLKRSVLVVVPRSNLISQWTERLVEHSDLSEDDIGWAKDGKADWKDKKIVVGLVHTLALDRFGKDFKTNFGVTVFDEVDRSVPPQTFAPVVEMFPTRYRIGASATLERPDGLEVIFQEHVGEYIVQGRPLDRMKTKVLVVRYHKGSGFVWPGSTKLARRGMILSKLAGNVERNALLAYYIKLIWNSERQCLVLSDRIAQLQDLKQLLVADDIPPEQIGFYVRSLPVGKKVRGKQKRRPLTQDDRDRAARCQVIMATYGMIALGTDIPELAGLVYATPQSEVEQAKGRIERDLVGKQTPVVVDILDWYYEDCQRWGRKRLAHYRSQGLKVKEITQ